MLRYETEHRHTVLPLSQANATTFRSCLPRCHCAAGQSCPDDCRVLGRRQSRPYPPLSARGYQQQTQLSNSTQQYTQWGHVAQTTAECWATLPRRPSSAGQRCPDDRRAAGQTLHIRSMRLYSHARSFHIWCMCVCVPLFRRPAAHHTAPHTTAHLHTPQPRFAPLSPQPHHLRCLLRRVLPWRWYLICNAVVYECVACPVMAAAFLRPSACPKALFRHQR